MVGSGESSDKVAEAIREYHILHEDPPAPFEGWTSSAGMSHKEIVERIANDPGRRAQEEAEFADDPGRARYEEEAGALLAFLAEQGFPVRDVSALHQLELNGKRLDYRAVVPTLVVGWSGRTTCR